MATLPTTVLLAAVILAPVAFAGPDQDALLLDHGSFVLEAALSAGTDPEQHNAVGESALLVAVKGQRLNAVMTLLDAGAEPDNTNRFGALPLHMAVARDAGGVTPLMLAARLGRAETIDALRAAGARLDMKDYQGGSIKNWALRGGHKELTARLESAVSGSEASTLGVEYAEGVFVDVRFPDWFKSSFLNLRDDLEEALDAGKDGIMLFISAYQCSYCKAFIDTAIRDPGITKQLTGSFDIIGLDIFDESELMTVDGRQYRVK